MGGGGVNRVVSRTFTVLETFVPRPIVDCASDFGHLPNALNVPVFKTSFVDGAVVREGSLQGTNRSCMRGCGWGVWLCVGVGYEVVSILVLPHS